jgi:choline dehydrogenase-like flavoprotein
MMSIMIKVRDGLDGQINVDESFSKPIDYDTSFKLNKGAVLAEEILTKAGVKRKDIVKTSVIGAHPGGTVRIGNILDKNCQTPIQNCYCMDTTIIPESWGLPPTVTVVAMAKRLVKHLNAQITNKDSCMVINLQNFQKDLADGSKEEIKKQSVASSLQ